MNTSSKIDLKSAQDFSMMHIIKILPTLKAISASCDPILMDLGLFCSSQYPASGCFGLKFLRSLYHFQLRSKVLLYEKLILKHHG